MKRVVLKYVGPGRRFANIDVPGEGTVRVAVNEEAEFPEDIANNLLDQGGWKKSRRRSKKEE